MIGQRIGRFKLLRQLGRGSQATVWLAFDPRLEREVALKLMHSAGTSPATAASSAATASAPGALPQRRSWLAEARAHSRLRHPHVVAVIEADEFNGQPFLVMDPMPGTSLARRGRGAMAARDAVALMLGVLDALDAAHDLGIVHRDLKPSNILLASDGRACAADFGIAAQVSNDLLASAGVAGATGDWRVLGTPGYLSPEAARGAAPAPSMDIYAAGLVLAELLSGQPLLPDAQPLLALQKAQAEDLRLPPTADVDNALRAIVQRALLRDPRLRWPSAGALRTALSVWLDPLQERAARSPQPAETGQSTLDFLLRRMRNKGDFPALSASVSRIQRVATSDSESQTSLTAEIMKDVALTQKLLRLVNTVHYRVAGEGVTTVSRAVALVGFSTIRDMALSVVLLEHMSDQLHAQQLTEQFLRALMAGTLAAELAPKSKIGEDAFLGSMFQNLGRLLTEYYFGEEAQNIRFRLPSAQATYAQREAAAVQVLGIGFEALGQGIAKAWGLPASLQDSMLPPTGEPPTRALAAGPEYMRWLGRSSNALVDAVWAEGHGDEAQSQTQHLQTVADVHATALGLSGKELVDATEDVRQRMGQAARAMGLSWGRKPGAPSAPPATEAGLDPPRPLVATTPTLPGPAWAAPGAAQPQGPALSPAQTTALTTAQTLAKAHAQANTAQLLGEGLARAQGLASAQPPRWNDMVQAVLHTLLLGLQCRCVVLCLRDAQSGDLTGRFSAGEAAQQVAALFRLHSQTGPHADLFSALCALGADTLIADAQAANVAKRLPDWYLPKVKAGTFLLLPLMHKGKPFAALYADKLQAGSIELNEANLLLVKSLRDVLVAPFAQSLPR